MNQLEWTHRSVHEARLWKHNCFITLTYNDENLPRELRPDHLQKFLKRLRRRTADKNILTDLSHSIRYLGCGQYGERTERPHYHLSGFNIDFGDKRKVATTKHGDLYESETLHNIWGQGTAKLAPFTAATAGYVAGYVTRTGKREYYDDAGQLLEPPFRRASSKPAIGREWVEKYPDDIQHGYMIIGEKKVPLPRYYTQVQLYSGTYTQRTEDRLAERREKTDKRQPERLKAAEQIHEQNVRRKQQTL